MVGYWVTHSGWPFKASENILVNRVLLSPIRENIKYPKGLPSITWSFSVLFLGVQGFGLGVSGLGL